MKKENTKEMGKCFPSEIILQGNRYFPEEYFNLDATERDIFNGEKIDIEDLFIFGTHAEGRRFIGSVNNKGKLVKYNESRDWEEWVRFSPDYDGNGGTPETIFARRSGDIDRMVIYFLLEEDV